MRGLKGALLSSFCFIAVSTHASGVGPVDRLYENGVDPSLVIPFIQSAQKTLDIEIYTMEDLSVINAIKTAIGRGVKVQIVQTSNPVGDPCGVFDTNAAGDSCAPLRDFVSYVNSHGGKYVPFSFGLCGTPGKSCFQHGKMMIVDGKEALISTGNFDPTNLCDLSANVFQHDLSFEPYDLSSIIGSETRITASPLSMTPLMNFIDSAKKSIQLENQYLQDPTMNAHLIAAAHRGVKVFVMVASVTAFGRLSATSDASQISRWTSTYTAFDQAMINTKIFDNSMTINSQPGYLHAKVILVDGNRAWVGSVNGSTESLTENREFGIFSNDTAVVKKLAEVLYADFTNPNAETWKQSLNCVKDACGNSSGVGISGTDKDPEVMSSESSVF
jgi:cardiolipin synthase